MFPRQNLETGRHQIVNQLRLQSRKIKVMVSALPIAVSFYNQMQTGVCTCHSTGTEGHRLCVRENLCIHNFPQNTYERGKCKQWALERTHSLGKHVLSAWKITAWHPPRLLPRDIWHPLRRRQVEATEEAAR